MSTFKKVVSLIIAACLLLSVFPMSAFAASTTASSASALVSAFASAADGDTIVLGADITLAQTISVTKKVTLSAGGHTITRDGSFAGNLFAVTGELTLQDITLNGNRTSTAVANLASELIRVNGGKLNLKSGAVLTTNRANAASTAGGVWLEGGELMGAKVEEFIRWLAERNLLFKLHMRNVTAPLSAPGGFNETFPDAGYYNLVNVMKTLDEVGFDGCIMNDHLIDMVGGHYTCEAYFTAYLKGLADSLNNRYNK